MPKIPITITLDDDVLNQLDAISRAQRSNRSALTNRILAEQLLSDNSRPIRDESPRPTGKRK